MKSLKHLNKYFLKYKWRLFWGIIFAIFQSALQIYPGQIIRKSFNYVESSLKIVNSVADSVQRTIIINQISKDLVVYFLLIISVYLARGFFMFLMRQTIIVMSRRIEFDLKNELYNHYQDLSLAFYRRNNTGDLMNRISEDVGRVRMYVGPAIMYSLNLAVVFIIILICMLMVNVKLTLYVLAPLPLLSISIYYVSDLINKKSEEVQQQQSSLSTFVQEAISGIRIIKSFVKEKQIGEKFAAESEVYKEKNMELVRINSMFFPLMLLLVGASTILTIYIGGQEVLAGRATTGNIAEFIYYLNILTWPMAMIGWVTSLIQRAAASQQRINEFLHLKTEIYSEKNIVQTIKGKIRFENVSFVYPDSGIKALEDFSFTISPGQTLAILGKTGSGKSTVANLLIRMYDVTKGKIFIDEIPIEDFSLASLRQQTGFVPQDVFLFSDTIANNISFGLPSENFPGKEKRIIDAAKSAVIYENILEFPKKFETMLGERGITLSGGQKQRVSIARAIIKESPILIFDDCLSAVDTNTENKILGELRAIMKNKTAVIISHRVSSVRDADKIIVLDRGKIVEEGNHDSLLQQKGEYFELYEKQMLEMEK